MGKRRDETRLSGPLGEGSTNGFAIDDEEFLNASVHEGDGGPNAGRTGSNDDGVVFLRGSRGMISSMTSVDSLAITMTAARRNKNLRDSINAECLFSEG